MWCKRDLKNNCNNNNNKLKKLAAVSKFMYQISSNKSLEGVNATTPKFKGY